MRGYYNKWANVSSAVMVFSTNPVQGEWKWGEHVLPMVSNYTYLGIDFGAWVSERYMIIVRRKLISYTV